MTVQDSYLPPDDLTNSPEEEYAAFQRICADYRDWSADPLRVSTDQSQLGVRTIGIATYILGVFACIGFICLFLGEIAMMIGILLLLFTGIPFLVVLVNDVQCRVNRADTPEDALRIWARNVKGKRMANALALTIPAQRQVLPPYYAQLPVFEKAHVAPTKVQQITSVKDMKDYYGCFLTGSMAYSRTVQFKGSPRLVSNDGEVAEVMQEMKVTSCSPLYLLGILGGLLPLLILYVVLKKDETVYLRKRLVRGGDGLWRVCNPLWYGRFDA